MRIFSKGKKETTSTVRTFSVGNVEKTNSGAVGTKTATDTFVSPKKPYISSSIDADDDDSNYLKPPPSLGGVLTEKKRSSSITNMMRILSGGTSMSNNNSPSSSSSVHNSNSPNETIGFHKTVDLDTLSISPELVPIVTLLSAQAHRRYHVGVFLLFDDLTNDGTPAERVWKEQYAVLIGNQLALWNSKDLEQKNLMLDQKKTQQELAHDLFNVASKPKYLNFTDAKFKVLEGKENTLVVSTTMKNRYFMKFSDNTSFKLWHSALILCAFEYTSLQEAYTGAFLSSKGAKLSDIKVILADSKFNYEDWVSVRFGAGMPWKRCYAVVSPGKSGSKKNGKKHFGEVVFYENDKKINNKKHAMATISSAFSIFAIYPSSPMLIDNSTMLKIEGEIEFNDGEKKTKKNKHSNAESSKEGDIFIMPEKHNGVPGYDTIIRFLVPMLNSFHLYGRPERLISARDDLESLLFGLPTLPEIHYLQVNDLLPLTKSSASQNWDSKQWKYEIRQLMLTKLVKGYSGCGSASGYSGAVMSSNITTGELFGNTHSPRMQPMSQFVSGSDSPSKKIANAGQRLNSNPLQSSMNEDQSFVKVSNGLGLSIKPPANGQANYANGNYEDDQPKTPIKEFSGLNIPQFNSAENQNRIQQPAVDNTLSKPKQTEDFKKSPYHLYKQVSATPEKSTQKSAVDKFKITSDPVSVGKASGANAAVFAASAPYSEKLDDSKSAKNHSSKQKFSNQQSRSSVSSNASIIDSYANSGYNNAFSKPTSGLGIVSSNHATPKKNSDIESKDDDYVVNTTDDPLADFYKLSRTLSNFNTLENTISKSKTPQKSALPDKKQNQHSAKTAKRYADEDLPNGVDTLHTSSKSDEEKFFDAPQQPIHATNIKKSPQIKNISSFVNEADNQPPAILTAAKARKNAGDDRQQHHHNQSPVQQQQNIYQQQQAMHAPNQKVHAQQNHNYPSHQNIQQKQPRVNTNPYYKQQQQTLGINSKPKGRPLPPAQQQQQQPPHPIQYQQQRQYSPVHAHPQPQFIPHQANRNMSPQQQQFPHNMNNSPNNFYAQQQQRPYTNQINPNNGNFAANKKTPMAQQYVNKTGGFSQFMPQNQGTNPYGS